MTFLEGIQWEDRSQVGSFDCRMEIEAFNCAVASLERPGWAVQRFSWESHMEKNDSIVSGSLWKES